MVFCLTEKNQKKISSHRRFFNAIKPTRSTAEYPISTEIGTAHDEIVVFKGK
jgi:cellulose synthase/poly-beta-1,6-N-acetylglucosamine synthase-like glycosyltransferase